MATKKAEKNEQYFYGVGRRKSSTVRSKFFPEYEEITIIVDGKDSKDYFPKFYNQLIEEVFSKAGVKGGKVHLFARGGGINGQAEAARLAIAHSLVKFDEGLKPVLKSFGYLTTDNRKVLPKRPGLKKARKREQWSKR